MKRFLSLLATGALALGLSTTASAQGYRTFGTGGLVLDDNHSHTVTLTSPQPGTLEYSNWQAAGFPNLDWSVPVPPQLVGGGFAQSGFLFAGPESPDIYGTGGPYNINTSSGPTGPGEAISTLTPYNLPVWINPGYSDANGNYGGSAGAWGYETTVQLGLVTACGSATAGYIPIWTNANTICNSSLQDDGSTLVWTPENFQSPKIIGASTANGTLTLEGNSAAAGNTATNANLVFNVGNNAATNALTILNNGYVGVGVGNPESLLANTNSNHVFSDLQGSAAGGLTWQINTGGFAMSVSNANAGTTLADGLGVYVANNNASTIAFEVQSNSSTPLAVFGNGLVGINAGQNNSTNINTTGSTGTVTIGNGTLNTTAGASVAITSAPNTSTGWTVTAAGALSTDGNANIATNANTTNTFGSGGGASSSNTFGNSANSNQYGNSGADNQFGVSAAINNFGNSASSNNTFGNSATVNQFALAAPNNTFGDNNSATNIVNKFGVSEFSTGTVNNTFGQGNVVGTGVTNSIGGSTVANGSNLVNTTIGGANAGTTVAITSTPIGGGWSVNTLGNANFESAAVSWSGQSAAILTANNSNSTAATTHVGEAIGVSGNGATTTNVGLTFNVQNGTTANYDIIGTPGTGAGNWNVTSAGAATFTGSVTDGSLSQNGIVFDGNASGLLSTDVSKFSWNDGTTTFQVLGTADINNSGTGTTTIGSTANGGAVSINATNAGAVGVNGTANINVASANNSATNVNTTSGTGAVAIGNAATTTLTELSAAAAINNSGTGTTTIGSTANGGAVSINATNSGAVGVNGTANINVASANNSATNVNTTSGTGAVAIGNTATTTLTELSAAAAINNSGTGTTTIGSTANGGAVSINATNAGAVGVNGTANINVASANNSATNVNTTSGTGAVAIGNTATTTLTELSAAAAINNSGTGTTTIGSTANGGAVSINATNAGAVGVNGTANINVASANNSATNVNTTSGTGAVAIGNAATTTLTELSAAAAINNSGTGTTTIGSTANGGAVSINATNAGAVGVNGTANINVASANNSATNVNTTSGTGAVAIGNTATTTLTELSAAAAINNSGTGTTTIGSTANGGAVSINATNTGAVGVNGTANINVASANNSATNVNTTSGTGAVAIGNAATTTLTELSAAAAINNSGTGTTTIGSTANGGAVSINATNTGAVGVNGTANINVASANNSATNVNTTSGTGAVAIGNAATTTLTELSASVLINNSGTGSTAIGNGAGVSNTTINVGTGVTSNLSLTGIISDADPTQMLTLNTGNDVRYTTLSGTALEGVVYSDEGGTTGAYRLGSNLPTDPVNAFLTNRTVTVSTHQLNFSDGTNTFATLNGSTDAVTINGGSNTGNTSIGNASANANSVTINSGTTGGTGVAITSAPSVGNGWNVTGNGALNTDGAANIASNPGLTNSFGNGGNGTSNSIGNNAISGTVTNAIGNASAGIANNTFGNYSGSGAAGTVIANGIGNNSGTGTGTDIVNTIGNNTGASGSGTVSNTIGENGVASTTVTNIIGESTLGNATVNNNIGSFSATTGTVNDYILGANVNINTPVGLTAWSVNTDIDFGSGGTGASGGSINIGNDQGLKSNTAADGFWTFSQLPSFSSLTSGSVIYAGPGGQLSQLNNNFYWDASNFALDLGGNTTNHNSYGTLDVLQQGGDDVLLGGGGNTNSEIKFLSSTGNNYSIYNVGGTLNFGTTASAAGSRPTNVTPTAEMTLSPAGLVTASSENLTAATNQLTLGATAGPNTVITAPAPTVSRTYTISDAGAASQFIPVTHATPATNTIPVYTGTVGLITNSLLTDNGTLLAYTGATGATFNNGVSVATGGLANAANSIQFFQNANDGTLNVATLTGPQIWTLPNASGTLLTSNTGVEYDVTAAQATSATGTDKLFDVAYNATPGTTTAGAIINSTSSGTNASTTGLTVTSANSGTAGGTSTGISVSATGGTGATFGVPNNVALSITNGVLELPNAYYFTSPAADNLTLASIDNGFTIALNTDNAPANGGKFSVSPDNNEAPVFTVQTTTTTTTNATNLATTAQAATQIGNVANFGDVTIGNTGANTAGNASVAINAGATSGAIGLTGTTNINTSGAAATTVGSAAGGNIDLETNTGKAITINTGAAGATATVAIGNVANSNWWVTGGGIASFGSNGATPPTGVADLSVTNSATNVNNIGETITTNGVGGTNNIGLAFAVSGGGTSNVDVRGTSGHWGIASAGDGTFRVLNVTAATNQLTLGATAGPNTVITAPAPVVSRTYTISDAGAASQFIPVTHATPVTNTIPVYTGTVGLITNSLLTDNGMLLTYTGATGATFNNGVSVATGGLANAANAIQFFQNTNDGTLNVATLTGPQIWTLPNASGTLLTSNTGVQYDVTTPQATSVTGSDDLFDVAYGAVTTSTNGAVIRSDATNAGANTNVSATGLTVSATANGAANSAVAVSASATGSTTTSNGIPTGNLAVNITGGALKFPNLYYMYSPAADNLTLASLDNTFNILLNVDNSPANGGEFTVSPDNNETPVFTVQSAATTTTNATNLATTGGKVGISTSAPFSLLSNATNNIQDAGLIGVDPSTSIDWFIGTNTYAAGIENNDLTDNHANGLIVSTAGKATDVIIDANAAGVDVFRVYGNGNVSIPIGNVGIGQAPGADILDVTGNATVTGKTTVGGTLNGAASSAYTQAAVNGSVAVTTYAGNVAMDATSTTLTITNANITANSVIMPIVQNQALTCYVSSIAATTATITLSNAALAGTNVSYIIVNP